MTEVTVGEIIHNPDSRDHFEVLGLPRRLVLDQDALSRHYYALSRKYHPDFHQSGSAAERVASLRRTAAVNEAHKTLRDPVARGRWWLEFHGHRLGTNPSVPPDLAMLVFEVQEALESLRDEPEGSVRDEVRERRREVEAESTARLSALEANFGKWDALLDGGSREPLLEELRTLLAEISYLNTLLRDIDRTAETLEAR